MTDDPKPSVKIKDVTKILICILVFLLLLILKIFLAISELKFMITNLLASVVPLLLFLSFLFFLNLCGSRAFSILFYFNTLQFSFCLLDCFYVTVSIQQHCCKHFYMSK